MSCKFILLLCYGILWYFFFSIALIEKYNYKRCNYCVNPYEIRFFVLRSFVDTPKKNDGGVNYYQHFHKDFIRPYGLAHTEKSFVDSTLAKRLETINCEFMLRPHIGVSEFMKTVTENCKYITENIFIHNILCLCLCIYIKIDR